MLRTLLLGKNYILGKRFIRGTQFLSTEALAEVQARSLHKMLLHAVEHVPHYHGAANLRDVVERANVSEALLSFPMIDKRTIRANLGDFLTGSTYRRLKVNSGGSTGTPFVFYMDRFVTRQMEKAFIFDQWGRVGYRFGDSIFNLRGRTPPKGRFVHHDRLFNIHFASSFDLTGATVGDYVSAINRIRPRFLHGYPSTMYQLATLMEAAGKRLQCAPAAVFCGSEKLFPYQRAKIEAVFDCRVYHWYGHSECLALGGACEYSDTLHFYPQYGYTELIPAGVTDERGRELFEIVATGFNNPVMPLIRYRTGDYAVPAANQTCRCGRNYLLVEEVIGRQQEFIVDANGSLISATSLIFGQHYAAFEGLESVKLHQRRMGELEIILVKNPGFDEKLFNQMEKRILELIGDRFRLKFTFSGTTVKTLIGKARLVEQELDLHQFLPLN